MTLRSESLMEGDNVDMRRVLPLEFEDIRNLSGENEALADASPVLEDDGERDLLAEMEARLRDQAESHAREVEEARSQTRDEVERALAAELEERIVKEREEVARVCERFAQERTRYFAEVEAEVVRLSLAIASHVLHRESVMDPLLLQGTVRVALEKVKGVETVRLHVPEEQVEAWRKILTAAHREDVGLVGDRALDAGECFLETSVGRVELGIKAQMEEIEKGFFDLLQRRPA